MLSKKDKIQTQKLGITELQIKKQLELLKSGSKYSLLDRPATVNDGVLVLNEKEIENYVLVFENEKQRYSITRFIPASGLATRMFNFLHYFIGKYSPEQGTLRSYLNRKKTYKLAVFLGGIEKFPFYSKIKKIATTSKNGAFDTDYRFRFIVQVVARLAKLPKALVPFHNYGDIIRTAAEEQLMLSKEFMVNKGKMNIHFTVPPSTKETFREHLKSTIEKLSSASIQTHISFSHQKRSTDTITMQEDGTLLRDNDGTLVFRAGGHGSLIGNLNDLNEEIIFLSNIDNISVKKYHTQTARYKKMLGGVLIATQNQIHQYARALRQGDDIDLIEVKTFIQEKLHVDVPKLLQGDKLIKFLYEKLNRPLRVCGMVKNEGEPGGGPFWVEKERELSLQIVESAQVNTTDKNQKSIFEKSTHFNPVDIVCATYDSNGNKFNLLEFVDHDSYFVTQKTHDRVHIKVLERPGLWNGAMANWNTVFVEVPVRTFNPVKTVNDLLRPMHQSV